MKRSLSKSLVLLSCFMVGVLFVFNSCKKNENTISDTTQVADAKSWFAGEKNIFYIPDWGKAAVFKDKNVNYVIIPSNFKLETGKNKVISSLIIADSLGNYSAKLIEVVNADLPKRIQDLAIIFQGGKNLKKISSSFTGNILILNAAHMFEYGQQFINGEVKSELKIKFSQNGSGGLKDKLFMMMQPPPDVPIQPVCTDWYFTTWNGNTGEVVSETYLYTTCSGNYSYGGSGSTGTGENNPDDNRDIIERVQDPCIKNALNLALSKNAVNDIKALFYDSFGSNKNYDVVFADGSLGFTAKDATTSTVPIRGVMTSTITFNTDVAGTRSEQYTVATIYHEMVHAELRKLFPESPLGKILVPSQHDYMAQNFVDKMKSSLKSVFPNLSDSDAWALSWGGLKQTSFFDLLTDENKTLIGETLMKYSDKDRYDKLGTYCK